MTVETTIEQQVEALIRRADPEREVYPKLIKIREQLQRGTFIGPSARAFIARLIQRRDNLECRGLNREGFCREIPGKGKCDCTERFRRCSAYVARRPTKGTGVEVKK